MIVHKVSGKMVNGFLDPTTLCGRMGTAYSTEWNDVTCKDCIKRKE